MIFIQDQNFHHKLHKLILFSATHFYSTDKSLSLALIFIKLKLCFYRNNNFFYHTYEVSSLIKFQLNALVSNISNFSWKLIFFCPNDKFTSQWLIVNSMKNFHHKRAFSSSRKVFITLIHFHLNDKFSTQWSIFITAINFSSQWSIFITVIIFYLKPNISTQL